MVKQLLLLGFFLITIGSYAQKSAPAKSSGRKTIGLVLSGGGAKGFAHIGAIQLLEECGIKPDYITGTSMGSIVGGLYAMGYTVEEMKLVSDTTNWTMVLSNTVALNEITVAEKPYYGTFLTELDIKNWGVSLPGGLIEGQNLLEKLSALSRPVHGIDNFLDFPIPFSCIATDIVKGVPVALSHGNIAEAIRASMAIPTAFTPVEYDTLLLIDGGWTRNLPVQEAKDMGADIIISVNVGAPLKTKDELQSMISILDQTAWMLSVQDTKEQLKLSDYVISPPVSQFSTFAFDLADSIIGLGYKEAVKQKEVFLELAKRIYPNGKYEKEIIKPFSEPKYTISNITVSGIKLTSAKFVKGRLELKKGEKYSIQQVEEKIGLLFGTLYYKKIDFSLAPLSDSTQELRIRVVESNPAKLKLSLYYDTENSVGLNLNVTLRNILLKNSRLIFDGFVSENPIIGLKYIKYVGQNQNSFLFTNLKYIKDSRYQWVNLNDQPATYNYREFDAALGYIYTIKNQLMLGTTIGYQGAKMSPSINGDSIVDYWTQQSFPFTVFTELNTFNKAVFPTKGLKLWADAAYHIDISHRALLKPEFKNLQSAADASISRKPYVMIGIGFQKFTPLAETFSLYIDAQIRMSNKSKIGFNDYSKIGGISPILLSATPFWGLDRNEVFIRQFAMVSIGFQWNFYKDIYLKTKVNYLNSEYPMSLFAKHIDAEPFPIDGINRTSLFGFGGELAYNSAIGPIRLVVHQNQFSNDLNVFIAVGYNIYKSRGNF